MAALASAAVAPAADASSLGIASSIFGSGGCPACHGGGTAPGVLLDGPTVVEPGNTYNYTFTIFGNQDQSFGGFNIAVPLGALSTGGPFVLGTKTIAGALGLAEVTHTAPKQGDFLNVIEFSFQWTAPASFTSTQMRAWGLAADHSGTELGDAASSATLNLFALAPQTPTPLPTATPGVPACSDATPLHPALISDPAALACQAAIAKAGATYLKKDLKAVRSCLADAQSGATSGEAIAACVGSATTAPTEARSAQAIAKAQGKARSYLQAKCTDAAVAALDACAETESELETCFLGRHRQGVVDLIASEYGALQTTDDKGVQKCQKAIGGAAASYVLAHLRTAQKCLLRRSADEVALDGVALCIGGLVADEFIVPLDAKVADAAATAAAKLMEKIDGKCDDAQIAALAGCGANRASAVSCLLCSHRTAVFGLISSEFGGIP
jgi:hypothetical protein